MLHRCVTLYTNKKCTSFPYVYAYYKNKKIPSGHNYNNNNGKIRICNICAKFLKESKKYKAFDTFDINL